MLYVDVCLLVLLRELPLGYFFNCEMPQQRGKSFFIYFFGCGLRINIGEKKLIVFHRHQNN